MTVVGEISVNGGSTVFSCISLQKYILGWLGEAKVSPYLASLVCPTDIVLQLGKACCSSCR